MIGRLQGILLIKQAPTLLLDVNGVGYELDAPMSTFYALPEFGQSVVLHTHVVVREDAHLLYGFFTEAERALFRTLIKISGVGPRMALTILSGMSVDSFALCIAAKDITALQRLPGVGKKTAERLLIELADKLQPPASSELGSEALAASPGAQCANEAVSALVALGYKPAEAYRMVKQVNTAADLSSETLIREALRATLKTGY